MNDTDPRRFWGTFGSIERFYGTRKVFQVERDIYLNMRWVLDQYRLSIARKRKSDFKGGAPFDWPDEVRQMLLAAGGTWATPTNSPGSSLTAPSQSHRL